jgi:hypothetical protein
MMISHGGDTARVYVGRGLGGGVAARARASGYNATVSREVAMRRWMTVLALLAAPAVAQDVEEPEVPIEEEEIVVEEAADPPAPAAARAEMRAGVIVRGEMDAPALFVRVREAGVLQVKAGEEWKDTTLKDISARLRQFAEEQDRELKKAGKSAYTVAPGGARVSRLFLSIDAEPTVPWQHIQWLMTMAAEQKYYKLEVSDGARRLLATLPVDRGIDVVPAEPPLEIKVSVHAVARREAVQKWGDVEVLVPTEIRFKMGSEETGDLATVSDFVRKARRACKDTPNATVSGEIKAGHKVPFSKILDLMETFEAAGLPRVDFYGTAIPTPELREATRLPYPLKNYATN